MKDLKLLTSNSVTTAELAQLDEFTTTLAQGSALKDMLQDLARRIQAGEDVYLAFTHGKAA
ncbi:hypothetical protein [Nocardia sp. NPDC049707]|uniref:hypothetical protein n=1 Tax=Nocardia sp. NPDC049707 TaxID=3154735 RepID=UPI00341ED215